MFEARNVTVAAGGKVILDDVSLEVRAGEVVALLGANGAGKSTFLKSMSGDTKLEGGNIFLENESLIKWSYHKLARKRAVLPQHFGMNFNFTAREVALLGRNPHIRGRETRRDLEIVNRALSIVEAGHLADQSFPTLSGGERQRIHLARILAQIWECPNDAARYLLLDEPTASLDLAHQHLTLKIARKFSRENSGVLIVLHDLNLAASYADRICLMKNGRITESGTPKATITAANIKTIFNFDAAIIDHNGFPFVVPHIAETAKVVSS